jgi:hypothetical protein
VTNIQAYFACASVKKNKSYITLTLDCHDFGKYVRQVRRPFQQLGLIGQIKFVQANV